MNTISLYRGGSTAARRFTAAVLIMITILLLSFSITYAAPITNGERYSEPNDLQAVPIGGSTAGSETEKTQKVLTFDNPAPIVPDNYSTTPEKGQQFQVTTNAAPLSSGNYSSVQEKPQGSLIPAESGSNPEKEFQTLVPKEVAVESSELENFLSGVSISGAQYDPVTHKFTVVPGQ